MARDLFNEVAAVRGVPARSAWTIAGSLALHAALVGALLIVPILSAFDNFVVHARQLTFPVPPAAVMPAMPVAPPQSATPMPSDIKPDAAPLQPADEITSPPPTVAGVYGPVPPGALPSGPGFVPGVSGTATGPAALAPPPPHKIDPIRPGGDIKPPSRLSYVDPVYPRLAIAAKVEGMVMLEATIDETGVVRNLKVLRSVPLLDQAAIDAVMKWRYTPTRLNGVAVPILLTVTVTFSLR